MIIRKGPIVKCKRCSKEFDINPEEFEEPEVYTDERNMGYEIGYIWKHEFECDKCHNEISITIEGYEYPVGAFNYEDFNVTGCILIKNPTLEIQNKNDQYDENFI